MHQRTELEQLGEFGLIKHLTQNIQIIRSSTIKGVGDDAAIIQPEEGQMVVTTDLLIEGIHFNLAYVPLQHLGYKAVAVNISDVCAMNAKPTHITVSIAVSNRFSVEALDELYEGILAACQEYNVDLVGGDTSSAHTGLCISVTAIGFGDRNKLVRRSGAKIHDLLCVTGDLGGAYMGLQLLEREKKIFLESPQIQPDLGGHDYIVKRQLKPEARMDVIILFEKLELVPTAMIDISDGLASEVLHIAHESHCGCSVYEEKIPVDPMTAKAAKEFGLDATTCALNGGEDYELLFTIHQKDFDKVKGSPHITVIGHITDANSGNILITRDGSVQDLKAQGWMAFQKSSDNIL
ncbi:MAG: thiamine-phosphate kinase [Flavobacteriales bacterium]|nr:thiamine-phosphate kinase [Flavobacteriales bacterium]